MKTYKHLYDKICSFENLLLASKKAQRCKRFQDEVSRFNFYLERNLLQLQEELKSQTYKPGAYREFYIYEPKKRMISAAPYRDRVVHHALCNVIEPIFDRTFIYNSYACRKSKGTHRAIELCSEFCRKHDYVLKCDIKKFFPSLDHLILKNLVRRKIRDDKTLWLIDTIIDSSNPQEPVVDYFEGDDLITPATRRRGIPIGNLTSQLSANIYLNGFDHFVKQELRCRCYIRYCDDFVVFSDDKTWLHQIKEGMEDYLATLRLKLHPRKCNVFPVKDGVDFLGFRILPTYRRLRKKNVTRFRRRLRQLQEAYAEAEIPIAKVTVSVRSWVAHASYGRTYQLRKQIFSQAVFKRKT